MRMDIFDQTLEIRIRKYLTRKTTPLLYAKGAKIFIDMLKGHSIQYNNYNLSLSRAQSPA